MSKRNIAAAIVAAAFTFGTAAGYAQTTGKETLTTEQKAEIRARVERLQAERANATNAGTATPVAPAMKANMPKHTSAITAPATHVAKAQKSMPKKVTAKTKASS